MVQSDLRPALLCGCNTWLLSAIRTADAIAAVRTAAAIVKAAAAAAAGHADGARRPRPLPLRQQLPVRGGRGPQPAKVVHLLPQPAVWIKPLGSQIGSCAFVAGRVRRKAQVGRVLDDRVALDSQVKVGAVGGVDAHL